MPYGKEIESVVGYDSLGNVSYRDGNGTIYNILDSDDDNISYTREYKRYYKISENEYFGSILIKSRKFSNNVETTRKSIHWKNGLVIKEEPSDMAENIYLYQNYPKSEEINIDKIFVRIIPDDLVANNMIYPVTSSKYQSAKLLNEIEILQIVKNFISDANSAMFISETPILEFWLETSLKLNCMEQFNDYSDFQSKIMNSIKISSAKYDGKEINVPIKLYITVTLK